MNKRKEEDLHRFSLQKEGEKDDGNRGNYPR
jgi:hypothetical protein